MTLGPLTQTLPPLFPQVGGCGRFILTNSFKLGSKVHTTSPGVPEELLIAGVGNQILGVGISI